MKYIYLIFIATFLSAQVKTSPNAKAFDIIYNEVLTGSATGEWTSVFPIKNIVGTTTVFFQGDTTGASVASGNQSDSCLTVGLAIKGNYNDGEAVTSLGWGAYYTSTSNTYTRLDSIDRHYVNVGGTVQRYMVLPEFTGYSYADSAKLWLGIGVGDSLTLKITVGSQ